MTASLPPYHPERPFSAFELEDIRQNWTEHPERFSYMAGRWLATLDAAPPAGVLDEAAFRREFEEYRWAVGRAVHDNGGHKGIADAIGGISDRFLPRLIAAALGRSGSDR